MGMSRREEGILVFLEIRSMAGKNKTVAPMFCMKPDMSPTDEETIPVSRRSFVPATLSTGRVSFFITPERSTP